jgi:hypothetical protein
MKARNLGCLGLLMAILFGVQGTPALATDVSLYGVSKGQSYTQSSAGTPTLGAQNTQPYWFDSAVWETAPNSVLAASVQVPGDGLLVLTQHGGSELRYDDGFSTLSDLNTSYPNGSYVMTMTNLNDGVKTITLNFSMAVFPPSPPHVSNWAATQAMDASADFVLSWDPWVGGTTNDSVIVEVRDDQGNDLFASPFTGSGRLTGTNTSAVIPAGTLAAGTNYTGKITMGKMIAVDETSYPGATGYAGCGIETYFNITTVMAAQTTSAVHQVTLTLNGVRENDNPPPYSKKLTLTSNNLVNLALGNAPGASVPTNQVLALVTGGENGSRLVVFNTASGSVLVEIGSFEDPANGAVKTSATKSEKTALLTIANVGSLNDASLMLVLTSNLAPDGSVTGASGTVSGWVDVTVTNSSTGETEEQSVVIPTGTMSTGKQLGTLIEP